MDFSTEVKLSQQTFDQINGNAINQPEVEVWTENGGSIFIGEDNNRHENQINTERLAATISGTYRSEEHTSELQSLMRISYAVFCLKKKTTKNITRQTKEKIT